MTSRSAGAAYAWLITLILALGFVVASGYVRAQRVVHVSRVALEPTRLDPASASGRAGGVRELLFPARSLESAHWILQTQQMLAEGDWRIRRISYENAPHGRTVSTPSPYRWWLAATSWLDHRLTGTPHALAVERAALWADPLLHGLLILTSTLFVRRRFGTFAAAVHAAALATLFPLASSFAPGAPDDDVLALCLGVWSLLLLLAGLHVRASVAAQDSASGGARVHRRARVLFAGAGCMGGLGLWVSPVATVPLILGIFAGAFLAAWTMRDPGRETSPRVIVGDAPWWTWGCAGATSGVLSYILEYAPDHLATWQLRVNHPVYALAWIAGAGALAEACRWIQGEPRSRGRMVAILGIGLGAFAAVPAVMLWRDDPGFLARDASSFGLTRFSNAGVARDLFAWVAQDGLSRELLAAGLPLVVLIVAVKILRHRAVAAGLRVLLALCIGIVAILLALTCWRLGAWDLLDVALAAMCVMLTAAVAQAFPTANARGLWIALLAVVFGLGATQVLRPLTGGSARAVDESEFSALVHRDLAHWLAKRTAGNQGVVLAPPAESLALAYYGGLQGLGSLDWENGDGIRAATRMLRSTSPEEGEALFGGRGVSHVILPSWDRIFDEFAGAGTGGSEGSFLDALRQLSLPTWMRPVPYQLPSDAKALGRSVIVLEVVEEQPEALEMSRLADYFIEMGQLEYAAAVGQSLRRFPADLSAWVARVQVEMAGAQQPTQVPSLSNVISIVENRGDRILAWDRRVALAIVLARGQRMDLAKEQVRRCLASATEENLRSLTSGPLYRLLYLGKTFGLSIPDEEARALALDLLPAEMRARLASVAAPR